MTKHTKSEWWERAEQAFGETVQMRSERAVYIALGEARRQEAPVKCVLKIFCDEPGALIADDVGMGKTYEALALASLRWRTAFTGACTCSRPASRYAGSGSRISSSSSTAMCGTTMFATTCGAR